VSARYTEPRGGPSQLEREEESHHNKQTVLQRKPEFKFQTDFHPLFWIVVAGLEHAHFSERRLSASSQPSPETQPPEPIHSVSTIPAPPTHITPALPGRSQACPPKPALACTYEGPHGLCIAARAQRHIATAPRLTQRSPLRSPHTHTAQTTQPCRRRRRSTHLQATPMSSERCVYPPAHRQHPFTSSLHHPARLPTSTHISAFCVLVFPL
jgi:hypothetical protein